MSKVLIKTIKLQKIKYEIYLIPNPYQHTDVGFHFQAYKDGVGYTASYDIYDNLLKNLKLKHNEGLLKTKKHPEHGKPVYVDLNAYADVSLLFKDITFEGFITNPNRGGYDEDRSIQAKVTIPYSPVAPETEDFIRYFGEGATLYLKTPETEKVYDEVLKMATESENLELEFKKVRKEFETKKDTLVAKSKELKTGVDKFIIKFPKRG